MSKLFDDDPEFEAAFKENRKLKQSMTCIVCLDEPCNCVLLPCAHFICQKCLPCFVKCPNCKKKIHGIVKVYLQWNNSDIKK